MIDTPTQPARRPRVPTTVDRYWLVPVLPSLDIEESALLDGETRIGADASCDIFLPVPGVEPQHCTLRVSKGKVVLTAHSRMTWVNDGPVRSAVLKPGQRLAVGPVEFRIERRAESHDFSLLEHDFSPLEHLDVIQRAVTDEIETRNHHENSFGTVDRSHLTLSRRAPEVDSRSSSAPGEPLPSVNETAASQQELERRRAQVKELEAQLHDQAAATLRALCEATTAQCQQRDDLERMRKELAADQAALKADRDELARLKEEWVRRSARLQENEQSLCTRQVELEQSMEQLEQERRDQYQREHLLQLRIEEINRSEAEFTEREAALQRAQQELESLRSKLDARRQMTSDESLMASDHWAVQREELESALRSLRDELTHKNEELQRLLSAQKASEQQIAARENEISDRESVMTQRSAELDQQDHELQTRTAELGIRENAIAERERVLAERERALSDREQFLDEQRNDDSVARTTAERAELDDRRRQLDEEASHLQAERERLTREQVELHEESERVAAEREQLDADRMQLAADRDALQKEQAALTDERKKLDRDAAALQSQRQEWETRQEEITASAARLAEQLSELRQRQHELDARETAVQQREDALNNQPEPASSEDVERLAEAQAELDRMRQSIEEEQARLREERTRLDKAKTDLGEDCARLDEERTKLAEEWTSLDNERARLETQQSTLNAERARLEQEAATLQEQQRSLEADRKEVREAQLEIQEHITALETSRDELIEEQERLHQERERLIRDQEALAEERTRLTEEHDRADARSASSDSHPVSTDPDEYEVSDESEQLIDEEFADEIVEESSPAEEDVDESGLRSQLAQLFGLSSSELNARARSRAAEAKPSASVTSHQEPRPEPVDERTHVEEEPVSEEATCDFEAETATDSPVEAVEDDQPESTDPSVSTAENDDEYDPIAAYMEKLLARSRSGPQSASTAQSSPQPERKVQAIAAAKPPTSESVPKAAESTQPAPVQVPRKRVDVTVERANIDTFRDLANLSARSAVAKHHSISLRQRFIAKSVVGIILFVMTVVLTTSHFWGGESFATWSYLAAAATCVSAFDLLRTISRLESNKARQLAQQDEDDSSDDPVLSVVRCLARIAERLSLKRALTQPDDVSEELEPADS